MEFIKKYLLFAFLLENIIVQTRLLSWLSEYLFIPFLAIGAFFVLSGSIFRGDKLKKFGWMYALMVVYIVYEFFIGVDYINQKTIQYLIAKITTFAIIIEGVAANEAFYRGKAVWWLAFTMGAFLLIGGASGQITDNSGRILAGYTNTNTTGSMGAITVGMLLFYMRGKKWSAISILILLCGIYGVLAGASRAGFMVLFILIFLRYGVNAKTVGMVGFVIIFGLFILPAVGIETPGIQRLINTYEGVEGTNRDEVRKAAEWMIAQRPWTGWGFEAENQGYAAILTQLGSHNGYFEIIKQMGYPMTIIYFLIIIYTIIAYWKQFRRHKLPMDIFFALVIADMIRANYESLFVGVHEYSTNLLFLALAVMSTRTYVLKHQKYGT